MRCPVCDQTKWKNVDHVRLKPSGMAMCEHCGFVSYPKKYQTEEQIKAHYRKDYRPAPTNQNLFSGERKLWYHEMFLRPMIEEWKKAGVKPAVGEIGAAMGMFLRWFQEQIECESVHGTEWTTSFRRVAAHEFDVKLDEDFDFSKKYDLIVSYHVLEHQMDPDKMLERYANCLKPGGIFYLSTPVWFREATNFGQAGFDIEYYWAPDHINCWGEEHLEEVIKRAGLVSIMKNDNVYGNTYLLRKMTLPEFKEAGKSVAKFDQPKYLDAAERMFQCWKHIQENETALAVESYKNCPQAWIHHYEVNRAKLNDNREEMDKFLDMAIKACPNTADVLMMAGDVMQRYERWGDAYKTFEKALAQKPNNPTILMAMANCLRQNAMRMKDNPEKRVELFEKALAIVGRVRSTSLEIAPSAISWIFHDMAHIPFEGE